MGVRLIIFILMLFLSGSILAQDQMSFAELDKKTFDLYEKNSWKELRDLGKQGLENGTDYYYLRMRIGIAEYKLRRYTTACKHFRKALEFNTNDPAALEYLYYSLLFSGRTQPGRLKVHAG